MVFGWLFGNNSEDDEDENERSWVASHSKEGTDPRSEPRIGWGDSNRDYSEDEHHESWGDGWNFWGDTNQSEDINLK